MKTKKMSNYVDDNRGYITQSKLKCYINNPEEYYLRYVQEKQIPQGRYQAFIIGTALDDLISYGKEFFTQKYYSDEETKAELFEKAKELGFDNRKDIAKPELMNQVYGDLTKKIRLTKGQMDSILGMYNEFLRQPIMDAYGEYEYQKEYKVQYNSPSGPLQLKGKLDRINLEKGIIRDTKTSGQLAKMNYHLEVDDDYLGYISQLAFYHALVYVQTGVECDVYLDVFSSNSPYPSISYKFDKHHLKGKMEEEIIPSLNNLAYSLSQNNFPGPDEDMRYKTFSTPYYPHLQSSIQKDFKYI